MPVSKRIKKILEKWVSKGLRLARLRYTNVLNICMNLGIFFNFFLKKAGRDESHTQKTRSRARLLSRFGDSNQRRRIHQYNQTKLNAELLQIIVTIYEISQ